MLDEPAHFDPVWKALTARSMDALDNAPPLPNGEPLLLDFTTAVVVRTTDEPDRHIGELLRIGDQGTCEPIEGSQREAWC